MESIKSSVIILIVGLIFLGIGFIDGGLLPILFSKPGTCEVIWCGKPGLRVLVGRKHRGYRYYCKEHYDFKDAGYITAGCSIIGLMGLGCGIVGIKDNLKKK